MKANSKSTRAGGRAYALTIVLIFTALGVMVLGSLMQRVSTDGGLVSRSNQYFNSVEAGEAATEKVVAELTTDFLDQGAATVSGKMITYHSRVPLAAENAAWNKFRFKDTKGKKDSTDVQQIAAWATV